MPNQQSQTRLQHLETNLEINSPLTPQQDPHFQHQREVSPALWLRNVESDQDQHPQTSDFYQQMPQKHPQHQMARDYLQRTAVGNNKSDPNGD